MKYFVVQVGTGFEIIEVPASSKPVFETIFSSRILVEADSTFEAVKLLEALALQN